WLKNRRKSRIFWNDNIAGLAIIVLPFGAIHYRAALQGHFAAVDGHKRIGDHPAHIHREIQSYLIILFPFPADHSIPFYYLVIDGTSIHFYFNLLRHPVLISVQV